MDFLNWLDIVFVGLTVVLLLYYLFFWKKLADYKSVNPKNENFPFASVVICAKNERENLERFLPIILNQEYPEFEVIVVDDNSSDGTGSLLNALSQKYKHLRQFKFTDEKKSFGKKQVLEFGINQTKSDYLVLTDADCSPNSNLWLKGMMNGFEGGKELVLGVSLYDKEDAKINSIIQLDTAFIATNYLSFGLRGFPYMSVGRNVAYKKLLFERTGGFKSHYDIPSGDDDLFINEIGRDIEVGIVTSPKHQTTSVPKQNFKSFFFQKVRHVSAGLKYNKLNLLLLTVFYSFTVLWYLIVPFGLFMSKSIYLILTMIVLKKLIMYSLIKRIFSKIGVCGNDAMILIADFISVFIHNIAVIVTLTKSKAGKW